MKLYLHLFVLFSFALIINCIQAESDNEDEDDDMNGGGAIFSGNSENNSNNNLKNGNNNNLFSNLPQHKIKSSIDSVSGVDSSTEIEKKPKLNKASSLVGNLIENKKNTQDIQENEDSNEIDDSTDPIGDTDDANEEDEDEDAKEDDDDLATTTIQAIVPKDRKNGVPVESLYSKFYATISKPGILAGIIGAVLIGLLTTILLIMFIIYRLRKKDEGSYALEDTKKPLSSYEYRNVPTKEFYA